MSCSKCSCKTLHAPEELEGGVISHRCPLCGHQNYSFTKEMQQNDKEPEKFIYKTCKYCGDDVDSKYAQTCKPCREMIVHSNKRRKALRSQAAGGWSKVFRSRQVAG